MMLRALYRGVVYLLVPIACAVLAFRGLRDRSYWRNFGERFGFGTRIGAPSIWVHAVSVGEVQAAAALLQALRERHPDIPLTLTTVTPTGAARARALFGETIDVRFLPYDTTGSVRRFFDRVQPLLAIIIEKELWPNLYHECGERAVPLVLASAAVSPRSLGRYRRLARLFADTLSNGIVIAAQTEVDAARFRAIGANPRRTHVVGNLKFDLALAPDLRAAGETLRQRYGLGARLVLVAGSTYEAEEIALLEVQARLQAENIDLVLVLAPRHPPRFESVAARLKSVGRVTARRSSAEGASRPIDVLLLDTLGELMQAYAAADLAFVGGSLVTGVGGHNLIEPAALAVPTLTGPHGFNAVDIANALLEERALTMVGDVDELQREVRRLALDPRERHRRGELGQRFVERNRGTLERLLKLLEPIIADARSRSASR